MSILEFLLLLAVAAVSGVAASGAFGLLLGVIGRPRTRLPRRRSSR